MLRGAGLLVNLGEGIGGFLEAAMQEPASFHAAPSTMAPPPCDEVGGRQGAADSVSADAHEVPMSECEALSIGLPWTGRIGVSPLLVMRSADVKERRTPSPPMPMKRQ